MRVPEFDSGSRTRQSFFVVKLVGCTCSDYHALEAKYRSGQVCNASDDMTAFQMGMKWSIVAEDFTAEAGEAHVKYKYCAFSLPKLSLTAA